MTDAQKRFLNILAERGPLRGRQIDRALPKRNWKATAGALKRKGLVTSEPILQAPKVRPKTVRTAQLACSPAEAEAKMETLSRAGTPALARRQKMMRFLIQEGVPVEVAWVYAESGGNISDLKRLEKMGLVFLGESETVRDPLDELDFVTAIPPKLTRDQAQVWAQVQERLQRTFAGEDSETLSCFMVLPALEKLKSISEPSIMPFSRANRPSCWSPKSRSRPRPYADLWRASRIRSV